jgi:hypothetical protein
VPDHEPGAVLVLQHENLAVPFALHLCQPVIHIGDNLLSAVGSTFASGAEV